MLAKPFSIYEILKQEILDLTQQPGSEISEAEICSRFCVSRTPVRTAMQRLVDEHLVDTVPYKGFRISLLDADYIRQMVFQRTIVETRLLLEFIKLDNPFYIEDIRHQLRFQEIFLEKGHMNPTDFYQADSMLHSIWFEKTGYPILWKQIQQSEVYYTRFRMMDLVEKNSYRAIYDEHVLLFSAIQEKRIDILPSLVSYHLLGGFRRLSDLLTGACRHYFVDENDLNKFVVFVHAQKCPYEKSV